jgi:hypothetical protein
VPGDVPWIVPGEKLDEEEGVFIKIAIKFVVEPIVIELYTSDSVMQRKPLNITDRVVLTRGFSIFIEGNIRAKLLLLKTFERIS